MAAGIELFFLDLEEGGMYSAMAVVDKCVYAFPYASSARRVLCIDPVKGTSFIGQDLGPRDCKYVAAAVIDECIYAIPFNARSILRLDHRKKAFQTFSCHSLRAEGPQFAAAAVVERCIYGLPRSGGEKRILRLDHRDVKNSSLLPTEMDVGGYEATVVVDQRIYRIPSSAPRTLRIDHSTETAELIGPEMGVGGAKYHTAVLVGKYIYAIPCDACQVLCIDTSNDTAELIGDELDGSLKYLAAAVVDGCVYGIPCQASRVLRIREKRVDFLGPGLPPKGMKYCAAAAVGTLVYGIPCDAGQILQIDHVAETTALVGPRLAGSSKFHKAAVVDSSIYAFPWQSKYLLRIDVGCSAGAPSPPEALPPPLPPAAVAQGVAWSPPPEAAAGIAVHQGGRRRRLAPIVPASAAQPVVIGHALERSINRWGLDIAGALTGSYQFFPMSYVPEYSAEECLNHVRFDSGKGFTPTEVFEQASRKAEYMLADQTRTRKGYIMVVYAWTLECEFYRALTTSMRLAQTKEARAAEKELKWWRFYIYHLERALAMQPGFQGVVFRGIDRRIPTQDGYEVGRMITWQSFSSATRSELNLTKFLTLSGPRSLTGTIFVISACNARCVADVSRYPMEGEVVFVPNTHFWVRSATRTDTGESEKRQLLPKLSEYNLEGLKVYELEEL